MVGENAIRGVRSFRGKSSLTVVLAVILFVSVLFLVMQTYMMTSLTSTRKGAAAQSQALGRSGISHHPSDLFKQQTNTHSRSSASPGSYGSAACQKGLEELVALAVADQRRLRSSPQLCTASYIISSHADLDSVLLGQSLDVAAATDTVGASGSTISTVKEGTFCGYPSPRLCGSCGNAEAWGPCVVSLLGRMVASGITVLPSKQRSTEVSIVPIARHRALQLGCAVMNDTTLYRTILRVADAFSDVFVTSSSHANNFPSDVFGNGPHRLANGPQSTVGPPAAPSPTLCGSVASITNQHVEPLIWLDRWGQSGGFLVPSSISLRVSLEGTTVHRAERTDYCNKYCYRLQAVCTSASLLWTGNFMGSELHRLCPNGTTTLPIPDSVPHDELHEAVVDQTGPGHHPGATDLPAFLVPFGTCERLDVADILRNPRRALRAVACDVRPTSDSRRHLCACIPLDTRYDAPHYVPPPLQFWRLASVFDAWTESISGVMKESLSSAQDQPLARHLGRAEALRSEDDEDAQKIAGQKLADALPCPVSAPPSAATDATCIAMLQTVAAEIAAPTNMTEALSRPALHLLASSELVGRTLKIRAVFPSCSAPEDIAVLYAWNDSSRSAALHRYAEARAEWRRQNGNCPLFAAMIKLPQSGFPLEPAAEYASFALDRLLGLFRVPETAWVELPLSSIRRLLASTDAAGSGDLEKWADEVLFSYVRQSHLEHNGRVGVSVQLWKSDLHRIQDSVYRVNFGRWRSFFDPSRLDHVAPVGSDLRKAIAHLSELSVFDFILGNDDREVNKNNFIIGGCRTLCQPRHHDDPVWSGEPVPIYIDQGKSFYERGAPRGNALTEHATDGKFCVFTNRLAIALRQLHKIGLVAEMKRILPTSVVRQLTSLDTAGERLKRVVALLSSCESKYSHALAFPFDF